MRAGNKTGVCHRSRMHRRTNTRTQAHNTQIQTHVELRNACKVDGACLHAHVQRCVICHDGLWCITHGIRAHSATPEIARRKGTCARVLDKQTADASGQAKEFVKGNAHKVCVDRGEVERAGGHVSSSVKQHLAMNMIWCITMRGIIVFVFLFFCCCFFFFCLKHSASCPLSGYKEFLGKKE